MTTVPIRRGRAARALQVALVLVMASAAAEMQPRTRTFHFEYKSTVTEISPGAKHVELWMPEPHDDAYQQITNLRIDCPYPFKMATGTHGNTMLHISVNDPKQSAFSVTLSFDVTREEHIQSRLSSGARLTRDDDPKDLAQYLKPDRLVPLDDQIRTWARDVVQKANAHTDLEMARAIYDHVVATVKYDKTGKGWGRGDIYYACEERRGNCTDFHAIFIGYARVLGIPARFAIGFPLPADRGEGKIAGYHCWAEFYAKGIGWVPVDASEAAKNPSKREYFFGAHDENRIEFTKGRDLILTPRQKGDPLNYFVYPYTEIDGKAVAQTAYEVAYRDMRPVRTVAVR
jgi:transglutaminase-like putative cysteine protease